MIYVEFRGFLYTDVSLLPCFMSSMLQAHRRHLLIFVGNFMSQGQWKIKSWLTVSQKLSLVHTGSEDIHDLVTSLVLNEGLNVIVTYTPLLESSRKVFFKFNPTVPKLCHLQIWGICNPEYYGF